MKFDRNLEHRLNCETDLDPIYAECVRMYPPLTRAEEFRLAEIIARGTVSAVIESNNGMSLSRKGSMITISNYPQVYKRKLDCLAKKLQKKGLLEAYEESGNGKREVVLRIGKDSGIVLDKGERRIYLAVKTPDAMEARQELVDHNLRLVINIAKQIKGAETSLSDLIQEGNAGLLNAADRFDYTRGFRFSTYAYTGIRNAMLRAIANDNYTVRIPEDIDKLFRKIEKEAREKQISISEVCQQRKMPKFMIKRLEQVGNIKKSSSLFSLTDEGDILLKILLDEKQIFYKKNYLNRKQVAGILKMIKSKGARHIIYRKYLCGMSLKETGDICGMSIEGVRQSQLSTVRKLRGRLAGSMA